MSKTTQNSITSITVGSSGRTRTAEHRWNERIGENS